MIASAIGSASRRMRELPIPGRGRQRPQRRGHQFGAAQDHRRHQTGRLVELVVATRRAGQQRDPRRHRQSRRHHVRRADTGRSSARCSARGRRGRRRRRRPWRGRRTAGGWGAASSSPASHAAVGVGRAGRVRRRPPRRAAPLAAPSIRRSGAPTPSRSTVGRARNPARNRAAARARAGRAPAVAGRRAGRPSRSGVRGELTMFGGAAISTSTSSISRWPSSARHREQSPRHPREAGAGRDEQHRARRGDALGQQLPGLRA